MSVPLVALVVAVLVFLPMHMPAARPLRCFGRGSFLDRWLANSYLQSQGTRCGTCVQVFLPTAEETRKAAGLVRCAVRPRDLVLEGPGYVLVYMPALTHREDGGRVANRLVSLLGERGMEAWATHAVHPGAYLAERLFGVRARRPCRKEGRED